MTIPSPFLFELPRHEMRVVEPSAPKPSWDQISPDEHVWEQRPAPTAADASPDKNAARYAAELLTSARAVASGASTAAEVIAKLATAADLVQAAVALPDAVAPDEFTEGMVVRHPEYGLGKIVAATGTGPKRTATVAFASTAVQKKFRLAESSLRPAKTV